MEPERRPDLRVGDAEREQTLERLRDAHAEGRLDADEFYQRLDGVYTARTWGDLDALVLDLPPTGLTRFPSPQRPAAPRPVSASPAPSVPSVRSAGGLFSSLPLPLRGAWVMWATVLLINLIVWGAVEIGNGDDWTYFWPIWVAGPWGAVLLGSTALWRIHHGGGGDPPRQLEQ